MVYHDLPVSDYYKNHNVITRQIFLRERGGLPFYSLSIKRRSPPFTSENLRTSNGRRTYDLLEIILIFQRKFYNYLGLFGVGISQLLLKICVLSSNVLEYYHILFYSFCTYTSYLLPRACSFYSQ